MATYGLATSSGSSVVRRRRAACRLLSDITSKAARAAFSLYPDFTADLLRSERDAAKEAADRARTRFVELARSKAIRHAVHGGGTASLQSATTDFARRVRTADLAVLAQHQGDSAENVGDLFAEAALFHSGRPVILVPRDHSGEFSAARIVIAWDGSLHCARAVAAAMPLLQSVRNRGAVD